MPSTQFVCDTPNCAYAIDAEGLNKIQLKALRMWVKLCPRCKKSTRWQEQQSLFNTNTTKSKTDGGSINVLHTKNLYGDLPKSASQKRKAARHDGIH